MCMAGTWDRSDGSVDVGRVDHCLGLADRRVGLAGGRDRLAVGLVSTKLKIRWRKPATALLGRGAVMLEVEWNWSSTLIGCTRDGGGCQSGVWVSR